VEEAKSPVVSVRDADLYATSFKLENGVEIKDRVFCVGFNKTGTRSLLNSFEILDLGPVASCNMKLTQGIFETGSYEEALRYARDYRSFKDRPWNVWDMYIHLDERFPGSYFILTVREPESWWRSVDRWITVQKPSMGSIYRKHLRSSSPSKESMIEAYLRHNREITEYFDGRDCFLVMNLEEGDGSYSRLSLSSLEPAKLQTSGDLLTGNSPPGRDPGQDQGRKGTMALEDAPAARL
jgi:hypothetical protein